MKRIFLATALGIGLLATASVYAADAPANATAQCKDGTYSTATSHKGACKGHQGVQTWLDKSDASASSSAASTSKADTSKSATSSAKASSSKPAAAAASDSSGTPLAKCKDGTTFNGTSHRGACKGHQGVDQWLDQPAAGGAASAPATTGKAAQATAPATMPAPSAAPASSATAHAPTPSSQIQAQPGGGAGKVWVNSSSKVYHCQGDEWYGKTKEGSYMTEAQAKAAGNRAAAGKSCGA
jgi:hypothetical protein